MGQAFEKIFGSRIRSRVLAWFFTHENERFFVRQLSTLLEEDSTNLSRELSNLEDLGILVSSRQGNLKYFNVNKRISFFRELKGLILKTVGIIGELMSSLEQLSGVRYAFLFGSYAKGEERADSDINLMIIGEIERNKLDSLIGNLEKKFERTINHITYSYQEFKSQKKAKDGFIMDVLKEGKIMLVGDEHELKKA